MAFAKFSGFLDWELAENSSHVEPWATTRICRGLVTHIWPWKHMQLMEHASYIYIYGSFVYMIIYVYSNYIYMYIFIFIYTSFHSIWGCRIWDNSIFDRLVVIVAHITRGRLNDCFLAVILKLITSCGFHLATQILGELEQSSEAWVENRIPSGYD